MKKKHLLILFIGVMGSLFIQRLFLSKPEAPSITKKRGVEKTTVKAEVVKREDLDFVLTYVGSIKAKDEAIIFSKVSGKLSNYLVNEGDKVEKGRTIALVDRDIGR